jgi:sugar lactone lactonase YvrE
MGVRGRGRNELKRPSSVATVGDDLRAVADIKNGSVVIFNDKERWVRTLGEPDGDGDIEFDEPVAVEADRHSRIWVADRGNHTVTRMGIGGHAQLTLGGKGGRKGLLKAPSDIALDNRGNLYVADTGNRRVQVFSSSGKLLDVWRSSYGVTRNKIKKPVLLAFSKYKDGAIWLVNSGSANLEKFDLDGKWRQSLDLSKLVDGDVVVADLVFYQPFDRMIVLDSAGNRILIVGWRGDLLAQFALPRDVVGSAVQVEGEMDLLVADLANGRVLVYRRSH